MKIYVLPTKLYDVKIKKKTRVGKPNFGLPILGYLIMGILN